MHLRPVSEANFSNPEVIRDNQLTRSELQLDSVRAILHQPDGDSMHARFGQPLCRRMIKRYRVHAPASGVWIRTMQSSRKRVISEHPDLAASHTRIAKYLSTWLQENVHDRTVRWSIKKRINNFLKTTHQTRLDLNFPELKTLPDIFHLNVFKTRLKFLNLESTQITVLPVSICCLRELKTLFLSNTLLKTLPPEIRFLKMLNALSVSYTHIEQLPLEIGRLLNLRTLDCMGSPLQHLSEEICFLKDLRELYLDETCITQLPANVVELKCLNTLSLTSVPLTSLPEEIGDLSALERLYVDSTQISVLPPSICRLEKLNILVLHDTPLAALHPEIEEWTTEEILARNGYLYLPQDAYTIRGDTLFVKIQRNTLALFAKEHLHLLTECLRQKHPKDRGLRLLVKYERELVLDDGGPSREFISTLLYHVIDQEKRNYGNKSLFQEIEEENGLYQLSYGYGSMPSRDAALCEDIGTFLSALSVGFAQEHDCKIGMVFSKTFYMHMLSLCTKGVSLFGREDRALSQQEKEHACSILAKQDPAYSYYGCDANVADWHEKPLRKLLAYLVGEFALAPEDYQESPNLVQLLEKAMQPEAMDVEWANLKIAARDPENHRILNEKIAAARYAQYAHICEPLIVVADAFKNGYGDRAHSVAQLLNKLTDAARKLSSILQGSPFTRNACLALMDRSICFEEVRQQYEWIKESIKDEVDGATNNQMKDMLACMTGAAVITDRLQLHFTVYGQRVSHVYQDGNGEIFQDFEESDNHQEEDDNMNTVCYFHTCSRTVEISRSILQLEKAPFLAYWYETVRDLKSGYTLDR